MKHLAAGLFIFLCILPAMYLHGLDYVVGNYNLGIFEENGHFSLSYRKQTSHVPLLDNENPRSSFIEILYNNRIIRLANESVFYITVLETDEAIIVQYDLGGIIVEERFSFLRQENRILAVKITYSIHNNSGNDVFIGIRNILDTVLGESEAAHFSTQNDGAVFDELMFLPDPDNSDTDNSYILSANETDQLAIYFWGKTGPDKVLLANWKRLSDSNWEYTVQNGRNFTEAPLSINDSAVALVFEPRTIGEGQKVHYEIVLSYVPSDTDPLAWRENLIHAHVHTLRYGTSRITHIDDNAFPQSIDGLNSENYSSEQLRTVSSYLRDLEILDSFISQIDSILYSRGIVTSQDIIRMEDILAIIRKNSSHY